MNLIPESNGLYKVKNERNFNGMSKTKYIILILVGIILIGFISQQISNFIGNEKIEMSLNYAKIDGKKIEYNLNGQGDYTVVFVGATGANLYEWDQTLSLVQENLSVKTFVYNRNGYGFSDTAKEKSINEQTEELKTLLRKVGVSNNVILVGEEYGSLIALKFAKDYPTIVKGMVLVDPYDENEIKSEEFQKKINKLYLKTSFEQYGTYFYLTSVLDKIGKTYTLNGFEKSLNQDEEQEFSIHKNKKAYRQAISNEISNLKNYDEDIMQDGMLNNIPLYVIDKDSNTFFEKLGSEDVTDSCTVEDNGLLSVSNSDTIYSGINNVLKHAKRIAKKERETN